MIKKHPLSAAILLALSSFYLTGCENDDYAALNCSPGTAIEGVTNCASENRAVLGTGSDELEEPTPQTGYENKGGVTGQVLAVNYWADGEICFDTNQNGACDSASEPVEKIWPEGQFSFTADAVSSSIDNNIQLLALSKNGSGIPAALYAPTPVSNASDKIYVTPFTTLVVSETRFNPNVLSDTEAARIALRSGEPSIGNETALAGNDYLTNGETQTAANAAILAASLAQAQKLSPEKHFQATASVLDQIYRSGELATTITLNNINAQEPLGDSISATFNTPPLSWPLGHEEEISVSLDVGNGLALVGSLYHNRLSVIDTSTDTLTRLGVGDFAASAVERDEIDAVTGASEQALRQVALTSDGVNAIVAVEKYKKSSGERGVGLYRANLSQPSVVPAKLFAEDVNNTTDYFAFPGLNDFALSADDSKIVLAGEDKRLVALTNQTFSIDQNIAFNSKIRAVGIDATGRHAFAALFGARTGLSTVDLSTGDETGFLATGSQYPEKITTFANSSRLAFYLRKGKTLSIYDITNPALPQLINQLESTEKIKTFAFSEDGKLALLGSVGGIVELYALDGGVRLIKTLSTEKDSEGAGIPVNDLAFIDDTRALISFKNGIQLLNIEVIPPKQWSDADKQQWFDDHRKAL
ncbi:MAG TPA: hypothetical protein DD827_00720 [Gammaproteobacteria bacterium]|jgi:WD40 repeat protein|nr:hypothetical protein [Gammaproteobacteria bacterium]